MSTKLRSVIISGGGTGGHIYPALAIADEIKRRYPDCKIQFVGAKGRMEMEKIPKAGYPIQGLWITGIERKIFSKKNLSFPFKLISSLWTAKKLIKQHQPQIAIGVGGFASGPLLHQASKKGIPTLIQEQNSFPGITNRILSKNVDVICAGFEGLNRWFPENKIILTGNPIRNGIGDITNLKSKALNHFDLSPDSPVVFIMGGSLGAKSINDGVSEALESWTEKGYQVIWQTGKRYLSSIESELKYQKPTGVKLVDFIERMDLAYAAADLIVSRAGAMSIAELALVGKPTILVPSPNVSEDHQTKNALALTENGASHLIKDKEVSEKLLSTVLNLMDNKELLKEMSAKTKTFARPNAAIDVVNEIEKLVDRL